VLALKLVRDPDEQPADYRLTLGLLALGSALYLIPLTFGIEVGTQRHLHDVATFLTSNTNFDLAIALFYVALALVAATAAAIFTYVVVRSAPGAGERPKVVPPAQPTIQPSPAGD
jgi:hypothetical protein